MTWALTHPSTEASARALESDGDERGDSPTPRGVWRAIFEAAIDIGRDIWPVIGPRPVFDDGCRLGYFDRPVRALSLMAGYGSDASELRRLATLQGWPVHITGVELFEARRPHLEKWCDVVHCPMDWTKVAPRKREDGSAGGPHDPRTAYDIIVTNPDFSHILRDGSTYNRDYLPAEQTMVPTLLEHAPAVLMLHQEQAFAKSKRGREVWRRWHPAAIWLIGPASFSGDGKQDSRCYWATLWLRGHSGPATLHMLRELSKDERRWTVPPGSEEPSDELPAAPGWQA